MGVASPWMLTLASVWGLPAPVSGSLIASEARGCSRSDRVCRESRLRSIRNPLKSGSGAYATMEARGASRPSVARAAHRWPRISRASSPRISVSIPQALYPDGLKFRGDGLCLRLRRILRLLRGLGLRERSLHKDGPDVGEPDEAEDQFQVPLLQVEPLPGSPRRVTAAPGVHDRRRLPRDQPLVPFLGGEAERIGGLHDDVDEVLELVGIPKFHIGRENRYLSASLNRAIPFSTAPYASFCSGVWSLPWRMAYLASITSPSKTGRSVFHRSMVSTVSRGWVFPYSSRNVRATAMDADRSFRGDASIWSNFAMGPSSFLPVFRNALKKRCPRPPA